MLLHGKERDERNHDRRRGLVPLVFRVVSVVLVLPDLQAARPAEHDVNDAQIAEDGADPLDGVGVHGDPGHKDAGPEDHLAKVIGATHQAEEACVNKAPGVCLLRAVLLEVRCRLEHESRGRDHQANNAEDIGAAVAFQAEQDGGGLQHIEQRRRDPDAHLGHDGNALVGLDLALHATVVGGLNVAVDKVSGKPASVDNEQDALERGSHGKGAPKDRQKANAYEGDRRSIANGDEPHVLAEAAGAGDKCQGEKDEEALHVCASMLNYIGL